MLVNSSASEAPPLKRPAALASRTTPSARAPFGMATFPPISTGDSMVTENLSPGWALFELTVWSRTTAITVSAGTTRGFGPSARFTALLADSATDGDELAVESGPPEACWSAAFRPWQPTISKLKKREHTTIQAQRRIIKKSSPWAGSAYYFHLTPKNAEVKAASRPVCASGNQAQPKRWRPGFLRSSGESPAIWRCFRALVSQMCSGMLRNTLTTWGSKRVPEKRRMVSARIRRKWRADKGGRKSWPPGSCTLEASSLTARRQEARKAL